MCDIDTPAPLLDKNEAAAPLDEVRLEYVIRDLVSSLVDDVFLERNEDLDLTATRTLDQLDFVLCSQWVNAESSDDLRRAIESKWDRCVSDNLKYALAAAMHELIAREPPSAQFVNQWYEVACANAVSEDKGEVVPPLVESKHVQLSPSSPIVQVASMEVGTTLEQRAIKACEPWSMDIANELYEYEFAYLMEAPSAASPIPNPGQDYSLWTFVHACIYQRFHKSIMASSTPCSLLLAEFDDETADHITGGISLWSSAFGKHVPKAITMAFAQVFIDLTFTKQSLIELQNLWREDADEDSAAEGDKVDPAEGDHVLDEPLGADDVQGSGAGGGDSAPAAYIPLPATTSDPGPVVPDTEWME